MLNKNIQSFFGVEGEYEDAKIVIFGAPFDSTTSFRPGARFASSAMRSESFGLESYSPYLDLDLYDRPYVFDSGDLELCFGEMELALAAIKERADTIISDHKLPLMLGGEHLCTLGAVRAAAKHFGDMHIIHFDAHTDLREDYLGAFLSHASVIRRCWDTLGDGRVHSFGIRSGLREEFEWADEGHIQLQKFNFEGLNELCSKLSDTPVYLTVDMDVMDPSVFPGTGTPEAGGVSFSQLNEALVHIAKTVPVIGCDLVELAPVYDQSGISTATALKLMRELMLALAYHNTL